MPAPLSPLGPHDYAIRLGISREILRAWARDGMPARVYRGRIMSIDLVAADAWILAHHSGETTLDSGRQLCSNPRAERPPRGRAAVERFALWRFVRARRRLTLRHGIILAIRHARNLRPSRTLSPSWRSSGAAWRCSKVACRYHLAEFGPRAVAPSCALLAANAGERGQDQIAALLGVTGERVRQMLFTAERSLKRRLPMWQGAVDWDGVERAPLSTAERVTRAMSGGEAYSAADIAERLGLAPEYVARVLLTMADVGRVVAVGDRRNREWRAA